MVTLRGVRSQQNLTRGARKSPEGSRSTKEQQQGGWDLLTGFFASGLERFPEKSELREGVAGELERINTWFVVVEEAAAFSEVTSLGDDGVVEVGVCLTWKREGRR